MYLSDFSVDRRRSAQKNGILHKILHTATLDLLLDFSCSLLPSSEVNLCDMTGHGADGRHLFVNNRKRNPPPDGCLQG